MKPFALGSVLLRLIPVVALAACAGQLHAQTSPAAESPVLAGSVGPASDSGNAWKALSEASVQPIPPAEWKEKRPDQATIEAWAKIEKVRLGKLAEALRDFQTRYPKDVNAAEASTREYQALIFLARMGDQQASKRMEEIEEVQLKDPAKTPRERFEIRASQVQRKNQDRDESEKAARALIKEFPGIGEAYGLLLDSAEKYTDARSRAIADEVLKSNAPANLKDDAKALLAKIDAVGKPLDIKFTAVDGREVDIQGMKGKVVLVDFWATWCGPCVRELPKVKAVYDKLHGKGFEIVGLSFDVEKERLQKFVKENEMPWPQFFDGKRWQNQFGVQYGIHSIPTMWLVDKKGALRDLSAREGLEEKIEKLLAE